MIYKAPTSGFYQVSAEATTYEPTGEFETVSNPKYKWYTPWRAKTITQEKYKKVIHEVGLKTIYLKEGENIDSKHVMVRIGGFYDRHSADHSNNSSSVSSNNVYSE